MKKFVILSRQRCGTTLLCEYLRSYSTCICHYELFNPQGIGFGGNHLTGLSISDVKRRDENVEGFYKDIFLPQDGIKAIGFKIFFDHSPQAILLSLQDRSVLKIILKRDLLSSYVSYLQATNSIVWLVKSEEKNKILENQNKYRKRVYVDIANFERYCGLVKFYYDFIERYCHETRQGIFLLHYYDVVNKNLNGLSELLEISSDVRIDSCNLVKQGCADLKDRIENYDEIYSHCKKYHTDSLVLR